MNEKLPNPWIPPQRFDENALMLALEEDIQLLPAFIESPRPEYLQATEIMPILKTLEQYGR